MRWLPGTLAAMAIACGGAPRPAPVTALRADCAAGQRWNGRGCSPDDRGAQLIARGAAALAGFRLDEAVALLEQARTAAPLRFSDYVRLHEQLGIAYAYRGDQELATRAFGYLLDAQPDHLLSYTLSPKATFLFERVRAGPARDDAPAVDVSWPRGLDVSRAVPIGVELVADPDRRLTRATLHVRRRGDTAWRVADLELPRQGGYRALALPALGGERPEVLQLYLTGLDRTGNEVLRWGDPARPREIALGFERPTPWYRSWWFWAAAGTAVAVGTGAAVYSALYELPDEVSGTFTPGR
jgi:hypothetical protein